MSRECRLSEVFVELADTLADDFNMTDLLRTLCDRSVELLEADAACLILPDELGSLQVMAATAEEARLLELVVLENAEGPCLDCYATGRQVANVGRRDIRRRWPRYHDKVITAGYRSTHALPLRLRDRTIGAIDLLCARRSTLSQEDVELGQALCDIVTISLLRERAIRAREILTDQLQGALDSRVVIEQAKGALTARANVSLDAAFALMRKHARSHRVSLSGVAADVLTGRITPADLQPIHTSRPGRPDRRW